MSRVTDQILLNNTTRILIFLKNLAKRKFKKFNLKSAKKNMRHKHFFLGVSGPPGYVPASANNQSRRVLKIFNTQDVKTWFNISVKTMSKRFQKQGIGQVIVFVVKLFYFFNSQRVL